MRSVSRTGDLVTAVCCCHSGCVGTIGIIVSTQNIVSSNGRLNARKTDIVIFSCGHIGMITSGSEIVISSNISQARIGDVVIGCPVGTIITGDSMMLSS